MRILNRRDRRTEEDRSGRIIKESAYEGRGHFRRACAAMAAGLAVAAVFTSVPLVRDDTVTADLDDVRSPAYLSEYTGYHPLSEEPHSIIRLKEIEEVDRAVEALVKMDAEAEKEEKSVVIRSLSDFASDLTDEEAKAIFDKRAEEAERARKEAEEAARREAVRTYTTTSNYVGLNANGVPMSQKVPDAPIELDENGAPLHYSYCITDIATAYCNDPITSTGTVPVQGTVAVDPRIIPYGTRMYITSADGRYVYGYCVAEDTGGFIYLANGPSADLFMYSESDCDEWGWRMAKIYILA